MKKVILLMVLALVLTTLAACGDVEGGYYIVEEESYKAEMEEAEETLEENGYIAEDENNGTQAFLDDLDYMMYVLENNFPFFYTAYWARGIDINQLAADARNDILQAAIINEDIFLEIMMDNFYPIFNIGHFQIVSPLRYHLIREGWIGGFIDFANFTALLDSPLVQSFYSTRMEEDFPGIADMFDALPEATTAILEEGRIAYIAIPSFTGMGSDELREGILGIYQQSDNFEHLIIDIRGNTGGTMFLFREYLMGPNITGTATMDKFIFMMDGEYITRFSEHQMLPNFWPSHPAGSLFGSADAVLAQNDLPQMVSADIERFAYGVPAREYVFSRIRHFNDRPAFDGKIWMLVDENVGSAAQISAWIAKDAGFATLVGEVTGGNWGGFRTYSALPNTGIVFHFDAFYITDRYGRPLEAGTVPHYFNREGMDALETVLAMIEETL